MERPGIKLRTADVTRYVTPLREGGSLGLRSLRLPMGSFMWLSSVVRGRALKH